MSLFLIVALPFLGALLPGLMNSAGRQAVGGVTFMVSLAAFVGLLTNLPAVLAGEVVQAGFSWLPELGLNVTNAGLVQHYDGLLDGLVIDESDLADADHLPIGTAVTQTLMQGEADRQRVAEVALRLAEVIAEHRA